jgi:hypothetical protein
VFFIVTVFGPCLTPYLTSDGLGEAIAVPELKALRRKRLSYICVFFSVCTVDNCLHGTGGERVGGPQVCRDQGQGHLHGFPGKQRLFIKGTGSPDEFL